MRAVQGRLALQNLLAHGCAMCWPMRAWAMKTGLARHTPFNPTPKHASCAGINDACGAKAGGSTQYSTTCMSSRSLCLASGVLENSILHI